MSDIGPYKTTKCIELCYDKPDGPPIEIEVEISGILFCDDPEWGIEARDVTAKVIERDLTEAEIEFLALEDYLAETFNDSEPCVPRPGEHYKDREDNVWTVVDTCLTWKTTSRERFVLIERPNLRMALRGPKKIRRLVSLDVLVHGVDETCEGDEPLFRFTLNKELKPGELRPPGDVV